MSNISLIRCAKKRHHPLHLRWFRELIVSMVLLFGWEMLSKIGFFPSNLLPASSAVIATVGDLARSGELFRHIAITLYRVVFGFIIGNTIATILGVLTSYYRLFHD